MKSRSMSLLVVLAASILLAVIMLLAACGGASTTTTAAPPTQPSVTVPAQTSTSQAPPESTVSTGATATTAVPELTPKYGGTLRIAARSIGANLGWPPAMSAGGVVVESYYDTLLHGDEKGNLYPWLAESFKVADDRMSITFNIRKGVKFHDGSDLTAEVVKWNLDQYAMMKPQWASVEVVDPYTVRVNFKTWDNTLPSSFGDAEPALYMVSKTAYDTNGQDWITTHPVGTGPFKVESFVPDATMKLVKNPDFWGMDGQGNKLPYLDGLEFTFPPDPMTQLMMAQAGEVDMVVNLFPGKLMADFENAGWIGRYVFDANEVWVPDSAHPDSPWSNPLLREAAEYAVDRATIAEKFGYGYLEAPYQVLPRDTTAYDPNFALGRKYDPAKARDLLEQAGLPDGFDTKLIAWPGSNRDVVIAEQQYLAEVGIRAEVEFPDFGKLNTYVGPQGTYNNALLQMPAPAQGPTGIGSLAFAMVLFGENWQKPPEFLQAFGAATSSPEADVALIRAAADILIKNALLIPVYEVGSGRADAPYVVADFGNRGMSPFYGLGTAWLNK